MISLQRLFQTLQASQNCSSVYSKEHSQQMWQLLLSSQAHPRLD